MLKPILITLLIIALIYIIFCAAAYTFPQYFLYHPSHQKPDLNEAHQEGYMATEINYQSADGTKLFGWMTPPKPGQKMILFLHGNSYDISNFYPKLQPFVNHGYGTFMAEYRGFGGIKGAISEQNLVADSVAAAKYLNSIGYKNEDIIVYGLSLGSHTAIKTVQTLQNNGKFNALILEVPFDSMINAAKSHLPFYIPDFIIRDSYDNESIINKINTRLLIHAAALDTIIPVTLAQNLYNHAIEPKTIKIYPHAHHNNMLYFNNYNDIMNWLEEKYE